MVLRELYPKKKKRDTFKMVRNYKLKMIIGGASGTGKSSFLLSKSVIESNFNQLGVSFKPIECITNDTDSFNFIIWDLKVNERFRFLYPIFCRGTTGAILCFDISNYKSFEELPYWINILKDLEINQLNHISIILVGTKTDLKNRVVFNEEVNIMVEKYNLDGVFYTSIYDPDKKEKREAIFKYLIEKIEPLYQIKDFHLFIPREDEDFKEFVNYFSECVICKKKLHYENLKSFYYSREPYLVELKERLFELIEDSRHFDEVYYNKVNLGISCCDCFKHFFD